MDEHGLIKALLPLVTKASENATIIKQKTVAPKELEAVEKVYYGEMTIIYNLCIDNFSILHERVRSELDDVSGAMLNRLGNPKEFNDLIKKYVEISGVEVGEVEVGRNGRIGRKKWIRQDGRLVSVN